jgi:hypothetical protein
VACFRGARKLAACVLSSSIDRDAQSARRRWILNVNVSEIDPPLEHNASFDLYALNRLTDCSGCYCLTNASGDILYVGQAASVQQRLIQHFNSTQKEALTNYGRISRVGWRAEPTISLNALERGWVELILLRDGNLPPLNRASGPI